MAVFDKKQFGLCGKTIASLRRNLLTELLPYLQGLGFLCREKRSENLLTVRFQGRENRFLLFGGRDESSAALIQGSTLAGVLLDETALMPRSFVEQACARCSVPGSRLWFNCNPEGPSHWFYQEWILKARERRALYLHFTMEDNPALTPRIRARYRSAYSGTFYRRFVLGEWTAAQGRVYDFYDPERDPEAVPEGTFSAWRVSVDYGTANPASFGLWGKLNGAWYRTEEYYYDSRQVGQQKTDAEYVEDLRTLLAGRRPERVIVDPSAASFIQALRRAGFPVTPADNDVADGSAQAAQDHSVPQLPGLSPGNGRLLLGYPQGPGRAQERTGSRHGRPEVFCYGPGWRGAGRICCGLGGTAVRRMTRSEKGEEDKNR